MDEQERELLRKRNEGEAGRREREKNATLEQAARIAEDLGRANVAKRIREAKQ